MRLLHNDNPDVAVARGAVAYSLARQGQAPKIGGGSARSYFLLLDDDAKERRTEDKNDGATRRAICILPRGSEPGRENLLADRTFALRVGQPVRFHLLSSIADAARQPPPKLGQLVDPDQGDFARLPPIATVLRVGAASGRQEIPVQLATALTEIGTLEVHCVSASDPGQRWLLEFRLRGEHAQPADMQGEE